MMNSDKYKLNGFNPNYPSEVTVVNPRIDIPQWLLDMIHCTGISDEGKTIYDIKRGSDGSMELRMADKSKSILVPKDSLIIVSEVSGVKVLKVIKQVEFDILYTKKLSILRTFIKRLFEG